MMYRRPPTELQEVVTGEKCAHDKCNRVATDGVYCKMCIQLPTKECNYCGD